MVASRFDPKSSKVLLGMISLVVLGYLVASHVSRDAESKTETGARSAIDARERAEHVRQASAVVAKEAFEPPKKVLTPEEIESGKW